MKIRMIYFEAYVDRGFASTTNISDTNQLYRGVLVRGLSGRE